MTAAEPPRPQLSEKTTYIPRQKPETFMVPLLKGAIESAIEKYIPPGSGPRPVNVLDMGCGGQPFRGLLESRGCRYFGLDLQAAPGITLDFICAVDEPLPADVLAAGPYDFILCTEVLEHVLDWGRAFANLHDLLAPGGRVLITTPHFYILHEEPYDFFRPTVHALERFARRHHLRPIEIRKIGDAWDILGTVLSCCRFEPATPSLGNRILAKTLWRLRNFSFNVLASRCLQKRVTFRGPMYLSNYAVLERDTLSA